MKQGEGGKGERWRMEMRIIKKQVTLPETGLQSPVLSTSGLKKKITQGGRDQLHVPFIAYYKRGWGLCW